MLNIFERIARSMAVLGGVVLTALIALTCISILGRGLNSLAHSALMTGLSQDFSALLLSSGVGTINGDFELVEAGVAFAIFAFLPICQIYSSHATVDIFTSKLSGGKNRALKAFWEVILSLVIVLITWRLFVGMQGKMDHGETTFLLQFPIWWAYAACLCAAIIASSVSLYCAAARVAEAITGRRFLPIAEGASH